MMMIPSAAVAVAGLASIAQAQETVLGVYMFHRHGDRTAKLTPPTNLTALGYQEVYTSGEYFRSRYVESSAANYIHGLSSDIVKQSQIAVSAPVDVVLQSSAQGFLQGLFPAVGAPLDTQRLRNGTNVTAPLNGYQLIPIATVSSGTASENTAWLESTSECYNAEVSSNEYFDSSEYQTLLNSTYAFYQDILPAINNTFNSTTDTFKNAYTIFDLINVAQIHNASFDPTSIVTPDIFYQIRTLADNHEFNLAYNASSPVRAIPGMTLAAEIVTFLNSTVSTNGSNKIGVQFGAYASFQAFFGLANLTAADPMFYGVPDSASVMIFELFTNTSFTGKFPTSVDDLQVRFLWHNGTTSDISEPAVYPLFGGAATSLSWNDFQTQMNNFAVYGQEDWCVICGNSTGACSANALGLGSSSTSSSSGGSHMSLAVAGVIGALVTLAVIAIIELAVMFLSGLRLVRKSHIRLDDSVPLNKL